MKEIKQSGWSFFLVEDSDTMNGAREIFEAKFKQKGKPQRIQ
ncbi:MAG: hypothetical protein NWE90_07420 [Candidatus Bathyarchaeota archaeon]|nr:hypothetical protein [Candidatus Bathyarchaeota archaeon]